MHIAICDDEQKERQQLQTLVKEFDSSLNVSVFSSSEDLLVGISKSCIDIILLDIEMAGMNGYEAAKRLIKRENPPLIIFITNSSEYSIRGYGVAFRYLPKPISYDELASVLTIALEKITPQRITIDMNGRTFFININDIIYIEAFGHHIAFHTKQSDYECRMKLSDIETSLPGNTFASPHKSFLVNLDYVKSVGENEMLLTNKVSIPISRRRKQDFEQALFRSVRRI